jgi:hypothetical protein
LVFSAAVRISWLDGANPQASEARDHRGQLGGPVGTAVCSTSATRRRIKIVVDISITVELLLRTPHPDLFTARVN